MTTPVADAQAAAPRSAAASPAVDAPPSVATARTDAALPTVAAPVVLFDGVCNLCHRSVHFILDRDPDARFRFASLQSEQGGALLESLGHPRPAGDPDSVLLVEDGQVYERSTAALRIARKLRGPWKLAWAFIVVPRPLRDLVYKWIARNRYRWFGKSEDACRLPTKALQARFL